MPPEQIIEGRKGEKSRALKVYDVEQRRLIVAAQRVREWGLRSLSRAA